MYEEPYEGVRRRAVDTERATVTEYLFEPGARFPLHRHPEEQITVIVDGDVELTAGGETRRLASGEWAATSGDVEHGISAGDAGARFFAIVVPRRASSTAYTVVA